ncbi:CoA-binding protein [Poseidonibacter lekithochrous]|jgi:predicted CoA-binding protein|uniref:CoA-binding protein n=1 Tax=Poseidonibacter TaxID=2321187 RepID=UPI001C08F7D7|nr:MULTISPECIES: CoA-binding protein [Poseidonibacter]MBU3014146.1 CoA-binding protein [Poseidonibacter lekithochrous]MDO6827444.1 CoA-binding protein [Poseidonibacter sp. 1_MG-2023]
MNCEFPSVNSNDKEIIEIFKNTKTIAIAGLSPNEDKASNMVARYLQNAGFKVVPIYPKEDTILGEKVYRSLDEVPFKIDMVDIFRKPNAIAEVVDACITRGDIDTVWTQLGLVNNEAAKKASDAGMKVVQNKCTKIEHANFF